MKVSLNPIKWLWHLLVGQFHLGIVGASGGETSTVTDTQMQQLVDSILSSTTAETGTTTGTTSTGVTEDVANRLGSGYGAYENLIGGTPIQPRDGSSRFPFSGNRSAHPGGAHAAVAQVLLLVGHKLGRTPPAL